MRIAHEYRAIAGLTSAAYIDDEEAEHKLRLVDAFPSKWGPSLGGKVAQLIMVPLILPFTLILILLIFPITRLFRRRKARAASIAQGRRLSEAALRDVVSTIKAATLDSLWQQYGLPERSSQVLFDARLECIERWLDLLYGKGVAVVSRVRLRVTERMAVQARSSGAFAAAGGSISFVDPIDFVVSELSTELPPVGDPATNDA